MDLAVVWTEPALADAEDIWRYIARDDPDAAERIRDGLFAQTELLGRHPYLGAVYERDRSGRTRETSYRNYRIFYEVVEDQGRVEILHVRHGRQNEPKRLRRS
jgi:plasmid stabilization system protein ParE